MTVSYDGISASALLFRKRFLLPHWQVSQSEVFLCSVSAGDPCVQLMAPKFSGQGRMVEVGDHCVSILLASSVVL